MSSSPERTESQSDEKYDEKLGTQSFHSDAVKYDEGVDVAVNLVSGHADDAQLSPQEFKRIRANLDWNLLPLLFLLYTLQFLDKNTLTVSSILGIIEDNHLTTNEYNNLGSAFYIGFIIFEYPHNWALQRFPVARWLTLNIFIWSVLIGLHALSHNYGSLFTLRFLLGASEGCVTTSLMIITAMFYTRTEIGERVGWTFQCNGFAQIVSGFISFGVVHTNAKGHPSQWQWIMVVLSIATFFTGCLYAWRFPNNPPTARFLSEADKIKTIHRVQANQNGIETKVWKKYQFLEAVYDPKTWLFALWACIANLQNGTAQQHSLLVKGFGFTTLQTTLLTIPQGATQIIGVTLICFGLRCFPNSRAYLAVLSHLPSILGAILLITLPWKNQVGLLCSVFLTEFTSAGGFVMLLAWVTSTTAGHTKRTTTNAIVLVGYALGFVLSTQFWKAQYKPRNYVPWGINLGCYCTNITLALTIRWYLVRRNKARDAARAASGKEADDFGYVERVDENGQVYQQKVEKNLLDLTDKENQDFRYCL